jgi:hypothetical protein
MVEVMRAPNLGRSMVGTMEATEVTTRMKLASIDETEATTSHDLRKEQPGKDWPKGAFRAPRRAHSTSDYLLSHTPAGYARTVAPSPAPKPPRADFYFSVPSSTTTSSGASTPAESRLSSQVKLAVPKPQGLLRPSLPSPQRSWSVMDYEPIPILQRPGEKLQLVHLPPELHYAIFDFLEDIDSTCLGLTSKHFYVIHRRMRGTVPLSVRREGPNDMEWAWRLAGPLIAAGQSKENALVAVLPRGQVYCRKCGISRCELHKHIQEWMGADYEYCDIREKFGPKAPADARKKCYRSSPRHPHRCGRHTRQQRTVRLV